MRGDNFTFKQFVVRQDRCAMKVGTDGTLLGAWAEMDKADGRVLDIGTGTGLMALMMAQRYPKARLTAIDIDEMAVSQAAENVQSSPFADRIEVLQADVNAFEPTEMFDSIVCNPPFFNNALICPDNQRTQARHTTSLSYGQLMAAAYRLLRDEGLFSLIIPNDFFQQLESEAHLAGFFLTRLYGVRTVEGKPIKRYLIELRKHPRNKLIKNDVLIEEAPQVRSEWYWELTKDFYINKKGMKVAILQTDIEWGRPEVNIGRAEALMAQEPGADLYVLPEMWATGFATEPVGIAEEEASSVALEWMKTKASELHCAICGSLAIHVDDSYRNRHYFVDGRKGVVTYYDKHHLFSYGHEDQYYTPGDSHTVVAYGDFKFLLVTCYDLRFPVWSRYSDNYPYDAIICVANWPESRQNAWHILTRSRAIENQAYLIGCNRVGNDSYNHYRGCSAIISPIGKTLAACQPNKPDTASFLLDLESLQHKRTKFKVLEERDLL